MKSEKSGRIFQNDLLEKLSQAHPVLNTSVGLALAGLCVAQVQFGALGALRSILTLGLMIFAWTLIEYAMHRFIFHWTPSSAAGARMMYLVHEYHHDYPNVRSRSMFPLVVSLPLALVAWLLLSALLPKNIGLLSFSVLVFMFTAYDLVHCLHHSSTRLMPGLKRRHMLHHFRDHGSNFGVTTNLWDWAFRSLGHEKTLQPGADEGSSASAT
ncbi:MAG TPA: sterol desaturase family protein [Beijerinckiaceae bacterium]|nr:sterol desaturase family protein [Beijerinckiaceae bacterium]